MSSAACLEHGDRNVRLTVIKIPAQLEGFMPSQNGNKRVSYAVAMRLEDGNAQGWEGGEVRVLQVR